jgi:hypothetical protein
MSLQVGIDIGQMQDPTAVSVAEERGHTVRILRLERLPLRQPYPQQVARLTELLGNLRSWAIMGATRPADRSQEIVVNVDVTGVGRSPYDMLQEAIPPARRFRIFAVTLTAGSEVTRDASELHVPKIELVDRLRRLMEENRLEAPADSQEARAVAHELRMFAGVKTSANTVATGAKAGAHDDLVVAMALSVWGLATPASHRFRGVRNGLFGTGPMREGDPEPAVPIRRAYGGVIYSDDTLRELASGAGPFEHP